MRDTLKVNGELLKVATRKDGDGWMLTLGERTVDCEHVQLVGSELRFCIGDKKYSYTIKRLADRVLLSEGINHFDFERVEPGASSSDDDRDHALASQMPGKVISQLAEAGSRVTRGTPLLVLEAMKMEHEISAPADGVLDAFRFAEGERVMPGDLLVDFTPDESQEG